MELSGPPLGGGSVAPREKKEGRGRAHFDAAAAHRGLALLPAGPPPPPHPRAAALK